MSNKTLLILRHEFRQTVLRKSFIAMTFAFPLLALLGFGVYQLVSNVSTTPVVEEVSVGYVDGVGQFGGHTEQAAVSLTAYPSEEEAKSALLKSEIKEYFVIPSDYLTTGLITRYTLEREPDVPERMISVLKSFLLDNLLEVDGPQIRERAKAPLALISVRLDEAGSLAADQGGFGAFVVPYLFSILLVMSIFTSSGFLLQGLGEEKQNRVMEILLSSVSARQLLAGKVLGLGAAGLVQIIVWIATIGIMAPMASAVIGGFFSTIQVPPSLLVLAVIYFILGYLLFAVLMAGVGSISTTPQEGQQLSTIFTLMGVSPFWLVWFIIENPNHIIGRVLSLFPITAPITVIIRLGLADIPVWELVVSIGLLILSIIGVLLLAAKIFRSFLLMYGKRPDLRQILKVVREA
jgi:ABC-2 type transport system permease protein